MSFSNFPAATPTLPAPYPAYTQQDLLDILDEVFPDHYLQPLKDPGPGYEVPQAHAKMLAFAALMVEYLATGAFILSAGGPAKAQVAVAFRRQSSAAGAVTVKKGSVLVAPATGREFVTLEDAVFGGGDVGPVQVQAAARFYGWKYNVKGPVTLPTGEVLEGEISKIRVPIQDPVLADPTIYVEQVTDATGGRLGMLDGLGKDRGLLREVGESDAQYRARVRALPDTVSPDAIERALERVFNPLGLTAVFIEPWDPGFQTCWNAPPAAPAVFVYNDPRPAMPFMNRWLSESLFRGAFFVVVPRLSVIADFGMVFNDTAMTSADHGGPLGRRAFSAYSLPASVTNLPGAFNGFDNGGALVYAGLYNLLQSIKAAGVRAVLWKEGQ